MEWVLIIMLYSGGFGQRDSVAVTNVVGFTSEQECITAGERSKLMTNGTSKDLAFSCVVHGSK